jgi:hypothetical protein
MKKMLIAAVVGGVLLFVWGFVSHELIKGLGTAGMSVLPPAAETGVISALKDGMKEPGLYFFPGIDNWPNPSEADQKTYDAKSKAGPTGMLIAQPVGEGMDEFPTMLLHEGIFDLVCGLAMAIVLMHVPKSMGYLRRAGVGALLGAYGAIDIEGSQHTWYHFPSSYFGAQTTIAVVGAFIAGLGVAALTDAPD